MFFKIMMTSSLGQLEETVHSIDNYMYQQDQIKCIVHDMYLITTISIN